MFIHYDFDMTLVHEHFDLARNGPVPVSTQGPTDIKTDFGILSKIEGRTTGDWVLIDTGDVIVHLFRPEVREFYQLEKMWQPGMGPATTE